MTTKKSPPSEHFSPTKRLRSFTHAFAGLVHVFKTQHNMWIHAAITAAVIAAAIFFHISLADWQILVIAIILVWAAEILNSAFEYLCDVVTAEFHPAIQKAKDIAAAAVLVTAVGAAILGVTVFWPYISR
jgi:diacylglycerol kinase (ATP)